MKIQINKFLSIISIILIIATFSITIFFVPLLSSDELWNFQNIFKMYNGFKIYNDSNVIITPIFFYIENIIFKIFKPTFFIYRISNLLIWLPSFFCTYKILKNLKVKKSISLLFLALLFYNTFYLFSANGPNYNTLSLLFYMIGIYYYTSNKNSNFLQGFIIFWIFFTKQTIGLFYILAITIYELYKYKLSKTFFKNQFEKLITFFIPSILILLILYFNGNLTNCINYTIGGLFDFSKHNFSFSPKIYNIFIVILSYALSIPIIFLKKNLLKHDFSKDFFDKLIFLNIFSTCASLILYPIFNDAHILMVIPFFFIILTYIFNEFLEYFFDNIKMEIILNIISFSILVFLFIDVIFELILPYKNMEVKFISDISNPYFGIMFEKDKLNDINTLEKYIKFKNENGTDVIICSGNSAYVMIPLKQSHGAYDLIFYGNLGYNGIEKMKKDILSKEYTEFMIKKDNSEECNQFITEITDFIAENLTKCGEILDYDIYTK